MNLSLKPETAHFIDEEVKAGRFASPEELIEAALVEFRALEAAPLDDETVAAIHEGLDQAARGEGTELSAFREQFLKRQSSQ